MKWVRTNLVQKSTYNKDSKPYRVYSKWHLYHSLRAGGQTRYEATVNTREFILTYDGWCFDTTGVEFSEKYPEKGTICRDCLAFFDATEYSVRLDDNE